MLDNRFSTKLLVENYGLSKIRIQQGINDGGTLDSDDRGNILNGILVKNTQIIKTNTSVGTVADEGILLYNDTGFFHYDNTTIFDFNEGSYGKTLSLSEEVTNYKINARQESHTFDGASKTLTTFTDATYTVFKIYINGEETTSYTIDTNTTITFTDTYEYNTFDNTIDIIYYRTDQTIGVSLAVTMYCNLPNKIDTASVFYTETSNTYNIVAGELTLNYNGESLSEAIDNTGGVPNSKTFLVSDDGFRVIESFTGIPNKITISTPFDFTENAKSMWITTFNILGTISDYSISKNNEYKSYFGKNNQIGRHELINNKNNITFTAWNQQNVVNVINKIPVLSDNFEDFQTNNKLMRVVEYKENTGELTYFTKTRLIDGINSNRSMKNEDVITLNYRDKVVIV